MEEYIDSSVLRRMFLAGVDSLESKKEWINELNVFPVPDGDTGTNMTLTLLSAVKELDKLESGAPMSELCAGISMGTLRGARGNSGVITSQLCRGFAKVAGAHERLDKKLISEAMSQAVATAYKAVMKPKEGTILTVAKGAAAKAKELGGSDMPLGEFLGEILKHAEAVLERTPDLLPVLKEAGVVDSGGQGLVEMFRGFLAGFEGREPSRGALKGPESTAPSPSMRHAAVDSSNLETSDIKFGYCTEFIIKAGREIRESDTDDIKSFLSSIGDSLVCVAMDDIVKVHVHTNHPGQAFEKGLEYGQLTSMKVDNMREEHNEKVIHEADRERALKEERQEKSLVSSEERRTEAGSAGNESGGEDPESEEGAAENESGGPDTQAETGAEGDGARKETGFVAVCAGEGIIDIYKELGADRIVEGGQTMNPSTEEILEGINDVNAETVFVFPNNGNVIMAAQQAQALCEDKKVIIIPTKTVTQGITALICYSEGADAEENRRNMTEAMETVRTAEITYAVKDTEIYGRNISKGDYMGIGGDAILSAGSDLFRVAEESVLELVDEDSEIVTIYYGTDVSGEDARALKSSVEEKCGGAEVELVYGGQPIYYYFVSVE